MSLPEILDNYKDAFEGTLWEMEVVEVKLQLKWEVCSRSLKICPGLYTIRPKVEAELERLVNLGASEPVTPREQAIPIIPVLKTDGTVRICGDFKLAVQPALTYDQYPLPLIEDVFSDLERGKKF
ncbi:hypothetical protein chiPu_0013824 [Chiloscyllium punctatum]|uniref:Uncharacterized protein n=1 Tax=Chiloscyllium punctatum TaxID=137246 RepID=A0A401SY64_CHIPU|nr:hypothetical protein [Chiloscyllium punctatum]